MVVDLDVSNFVCLVYRFGFDAMSIVRRRDTAFAKVTYQCVSPPSHGAQRRMKELARHHVPRARTIQPTIIAEVSLFDRFATFTTHWFLDKEESQPL